MGPSHQIRTAGGRYPTGDLSSPTARAVGCARHRDPTHGGDSTMVVQAYILIQTDVGKAAEVATRDRPGQGRHPRRGRHRPLRRDRARRGPQRRRARQARGREGAEPRRHHPHPDLPGRPHLTGRNPPAPAPQAVRGPGRACVLRPGRAGPACSRPAARSRSAFRPCASPPADQAVCRRLVDALPDTVAGQDRRKTQPAAALGGAWGDPAIVAHCGVGVPAELTRTLDAARWPTASAGSCPRRQVDDQSADVVMSTAGYRPVLQVTVPATYRPSGLAAAMVELGPMVKEYTHARRALPVSGDAGLPQRRPVPRAARAGSAGRPARGSRARSPPTSAGTSTSA